MRSRSATRPSGTSRSRQWFLYGADLVELDQHGIGGALLDAASNELRIGDVKIISDDLDSRAELGGLLPEALPVVLVEAVLDRDDGILIDPARIQRGKLGRGHPPAGLDEMIAAAGSKGGSRWIERDRHLLAGRQAGGLDCLHYEFAGFVVAGEFGRETALSTP